MKYTENAETLRFLELTKDQQLAVVREKLHENLVERNRLMGKSLRTNSSKVKASCTSQLRCIQRRIEVACDFISKVNQEEVR